MSIITNKGYVSFTVGDEWPVLSMQTKMPVAAAVYQIPNNADLEISDSTNLIIKLHQPETEEAKSSLATFGKKYGVAEPTVKTNDAWTIYTQQANQGSSLYTIIDATKNIADVTVAVRLAWPILPNNPKDHDKRMETLFETFLKSVHGEIGTYNSTDDDVIRRPQ